MKKSEKLELFNTKDYIDRDNQNYYYQVVVKNKILEIKSDLLSFKKEGW